MVTPIGETMPVDRSPRERRSRDISVFRNQHSKPVSGVFPTIYSTLSVEALVSQVLSQYAIAPVVSCCFWHRGLSDVYLVKTEKRPYILRVSHHHWRSAADIYFELNLLDFFRQQGLPVAHPLQTTDNQIAVTIDAPEGQRYAALFVYADGEVPLGDLDVAQSRQLGEILAKLHCASLSFQTPFRRDDLCEEYLFDRSFETISPFLQHRPRDLDYLNEAIAHSKSCLQALPKTEPYWVVCWGDPHSGNAHFTPDGGVTLFDFDQCGYGWRAFDLAKFLHIALRTGISRGIRNGFLEGYQSVSPLAEKEVEMLQPLTQAAHFWSWAIALTNAAFHNYSRLDDSYFTQRLEQLKLLRSHDWQLF